MKRVADEARVRAAFEGAGQGHVFAAWPKLDAHAREQLLAELARIDLDLVGRLGGEEFGVFLVDANYDEALTAAERIRDAVAAIRFVPGGVAHPLSVSIGRSQLMN